SIARRYLARILVRASTSLMSMRARIRASRRVEPISVIDPEGYRRLGEFPGLVGLALRPAQRRWRPEHGPVSAHRPRRPGAVPPPPGGPGCGARRLRRSAPAAA